MIYMDSIDMLGDYHFLTYVGDGSYQVLLILCLLLYPEICICSITNIEHYL